MKSYLKTIVRDGGKGRFGIGLELFRLSAAESELTAEEEEVLEEEEDKNSVAILRVYEEIGENFWDGSGMSVKKFAEALDELSGISKLNIHINSLGGDTHTAQAIYNLIGDFEAESTSYIDGVAASAATVVASGANKVVMRHNANYMIHNPWTITMGNATAMRKAAEDLDKVTEPIVNVYKEQTGNKISRAKITELMNEETWLTADEALQYGFVDEVRGKTNAIARVDASHIVSCGRIFNIARYQYKHVPEYPTIKSPVNKKEEPKAKPPKGKMTLEELQQVDPDLVASMYADAGKRERERLTALNTMMAPGCEGIVQKAIESGASPASIALECFNIVKEGNESQARVNQLKRDAAPAGGVPAGDAPFIPNNNGKKEEPKKKGAALLAEAIKKDKSQEARAKLNGRLM
jgi:ATP-dependent Clp protease, protease subunit